MNPILKNVLAVVVGWLIGCLVNYAIIMAGGSLIEPPVGVDPSDMESIKANIHLYEVKHFITPLLAHALGTLVGAFIAAKFAATKKMEMAWTVGGIFFLGGIAAAMMIGAPWWMTASDLLLAYFPMAWIGGKLAGAQSNV